MGRHSAPRRHGIVMVLGAAALVGSAGIAWAVGGSPDGDPRPGGATTSLPASTTPGGAAPTPQVSATSAPVVLVVPGATPATSPDGTTVLSTEATTAAVPSSTPTPTRTKPGRGGPPTPKPTKPHK